MKLWYTLSLIFLLPFHIYAPDKEPTAPKEKDYEECVYEWLRTFAQVLQLGKERHYKIADPEICMTEAIRGFVKTLDPHSDFFDKDTYKKMMESISGEFFGIGIIIDNTRLQKDKVLLIIDTIPDGPADKSGIKPLDKIIEINGEALEGMSTEEAMSKIKGEKNTKVHIKIMRDGQQDPVSFSIVRDVVKEHNSLSFQLDNHGIYYLSLTMFTENAIKQIEQLLKKSKEKKYKALILDLRNNSGGLLSSVVDIAGLFLEKNSLVVTTKNKDGMVTKKYTTSREPIHADIPIFILINNYTASAAEILAGSLKIHSDLQSKNSKNQKNLMVFLVGSTSFGKGSVQDVIPVGNNCALKLTESLYFLPEDTSIQAVGITPDFEIEKTLPPTEQMQWFKKFYGSEKALANHITLDAKKDAEKKKIDTTDEKLTWSERAKKSLESDNQLRDAVTLINIFHMGRQCFPEKMQSRKSAVEFMNSIAVTSKPLGLVEVKN